MPKNNVANPFKTIEHEGSTTPIQDANAGSDIYGGIIDLNPDAWGDRAAEAAGNPTYVQNSGDWEDFIKERLGLQGGKSAERSNPYSVETGNQARGGQLSALDQLYNGTSTVGAQAGQAMGQLGRQVSGATAGGSGLSQELASRAGAEGALGIAGQAGDARLAEFMNQQKQAGAGYGNMRGQDQSQSSAFSKAGGAARGQDDALVDFYARMGSDLKSRNNQLKIDDLKTRKRLAVYKDKSNWDTIKAGAETAATVIKMIA